MKQIRRTFVLTNDKGLHARAAALLVTAMARYDATVTLYHNELKAECDSILSVLTLACPKNSTLTVEVFGAEASQAMDEAARLIEGGFGENGDEG